MPLQVFPVPRHGLAVPREHAAGTGSTVDDDAEPAGMHALANAREQPDLGRERRGAQRNVDAGENERAGTM